MVEFNKEFMKKAVKIFIIIFIVGAVFYRYFYYVDFKNKCYIKLKPSILEFSSQNIKEAIKVLKYAVPGEYIKLCSNVKLVNPNFVCSSFNGGCYRPVYGEKREINIGTAHGSYLGWTSAVIAHEACHAIQDHENRPYSEEECYKVSNEVLKETIRY